MNRKPQERKIVQNRIKYNYNILKKPLQNKMSSQIKDGKDFLQAIKFRRQQRVATGAGNVRKVEWWSRCGA